MNDLLPANSTNQERALSLATARAGSVPVQGRTLWDPQTCPAGLLPWLGWALSVDDWNADWSEAQKRNAIAASVQVHRRKGTLGALRRALSAVGYEVTVNEQTGEAYTFSLAVNVGEQGINSPAIYDDVEAVALSAKNARSHLVGVNALGIVRGNTKIMTAGLSGEDTLVWPFIVELLEGRVVSRILTGEHTTDTVSIFDYN